MREVGALLKVGGCLVYVVFYLEVVEWMERLAVCVCHVFYGVLDCLDVVEVMKLGMVSRCLWQCVRWYFRVRLNLGRHIGEFVGDSLSFRVLMRRTQAVIVGDFVWRFMGESEEGLRLNEMVLCVHCRDLCQWDLRLRGEGYVLYRRLFVGFYVYEVLVYRREGNWVREIVVFPLAVKNAVWKLFFDFRRWDVIGYDYLESARVSVALGRKWWAGGRLLVGDRIGRRCVGMTKCGMVSVNC